MKSLPIGIVLFLLPLLIMAQKPDVNPELKNFPAHIIGRVHELDVNKTMSVKRQVELAKRLVTIDSMANTALNKGKSLDSVASYYQNEYRNLSEVLSPLEMNDYFLDKIAKKTSYHPPMSDYELQKYDPANKNLFVSPISYVLKFRSELSLSQDVIDKLTPYLFKRVPSPMQPWRMEFLILSSNLKPNQFKRYFELMNEPKAKYYTNIDWARLRYSYVETDRYAIKSTDTNALKKNIYKYWLNRVSAKDIAESYPTYLPDSAFLKNELEKPDALFILDARSTQVEKSSPLEFMIKYYDYLKLSENQFQMVVKKYIDFKKAELKQQFSAAMHDTKIYGPINTEGVLSTEQMKIYKELRRTKIQEVGINTP